MSAHVVGRYELIREIGAGAMGRVFQAVDTETGQTVAAKILIAGSEIDVQSLLRFQREGAVLATLNHPNIVQVYATYLEDGVNSIIMEFLDGRSLGQILRAEMLPLARTQRLVQQVAAALAYAHSRGIVHRDVKPDNIMVVADDHVKVTDFGIARVLQDGLPFGTLTGTGAALGTPWYMSPQLDRALGGVSVSAAGHPARSRLAILLAGAGVVVVAGIVALALFHSLSSTSTAAPAIKLSIAGIHRGRLYSSGQTVLLGWSAIPQADVYRVQVATRETDPTDATVFKHPIVTGLVTRDSYAIHVVGRQFYYWRVQADVHGRWEHYSHSMDFLVNSPSITTPFPLSPPNNSSLSAARVQLCWSRVSGATDYDLKVDGVAVTTPRKSTCAWLQLHPGNYRWRVAAQARGVRLYTGPDSRAALFTINERATPTPQPLPTATTPPTVAAKATSAPQQARKRHHAGSSQPTPAGQTKTATSPSTALPAATATLFPTRQGATFAYNYLVVTTPEGQVRRNIALDHPYVVVITVTVHHLAAGRDAKVKIVRLRTLLVPGQGYKLVRKSSIMLTAHGGRNVFTFRATIGRPGHYRLVEIVTIEGRSRIRRYDLLVN